MTRLGTNVTPCDRGTFPIPFLNTARCNESDPESSSAPSLTAVGATCGFAWRLAGHKAQRWGGRQPRRLCPGVTSGTSHAVGWELPWCLPWESRQVVCVSVALSSGDFRWLGFHRRLRVSPGVPALPPHCDSAFVCPCCGCRL